MPIITPVTLPNLRHLEFRGVRTYLETVVHRTTTPHLNKLQITFFNQLTYFVQRLLQFIEAAENLSFETFEIASLTFSDKMVSIMAYPYGKNKVYTLDIAVKCWHLDWQVSSVTQIFHSLGQTFSAVKYLVLQHNVQSQSSEEHNVVDRAECRKLLSLFRGVEVLYIQSGLVEELSRSWNWRMESSL